MPFIENRREFAVRQACECIRVGNAFLFANGSRWVEEGFGRSAGYEPPSDSVALLLVRAEFVRAKLGSALTTYNADRQTVAVQADYHARGVGPSPDAFFPGWEADLTTRAGEIARLQAQLAEIEGALPPTHRGDYDQRRSEQRQRARGVLSALQQLPGF